MNRLLLGVQVPLLINTEEGSTREVTPDLWLAGESVHMLECPYGSFHTANINKRFETDPLGACRKGLAHDYLPFVILADCYCASARKGLTGRSTVGTRTTVCNAIWYNQYLMAPSSAHHPCSTSPPHVRL